MQKVSPSRVDGLLSLPRSVKNALAVVMDAALCALTVWLAICFRFESWVSLSGYQWLAVVLSILLAIPLLTAFGFYHTVIRFAGKQTIAAALRAMCVYTVIFSACFTIYGFPLVPRTIGILQPLLLLLSLALMRLLASQVLGEDLGSTNSLDSLPSVLIYGAGTSGQQLAASILSKRECKVVGFLDDNTSLHKASIAGISIYSPDELPALCTEYHVRDVLLAIPDLSRSRRNEIIKLLGKSRVAIRTLPSLTDLALGRVSESMLRELDIEDLLGRDPVAPIPDLLTKDVKGKIVMVTGAGGSIGSELCRQIVRLSPNTLVLLDLSEIALYVINEELQQASLGSGLALIPVLANVQDPTQIGHIIGYHHPHTIYHAAAYKHVPLVEINPLPALRNNIVGTLNLAQAALMYGVSSMVLVSTDKAVRPTNIMGASKRLAEMVIQALASENKNRENSTRFSIVRFGNVLGSSGSVVPKFRAQIRSGGPLTITHPDVTRYFMTIPEAALLVIQAGGMQQDHRQGCFVYLLDMGESVKIIDLAHMMIKLSGYSIRDASNPDGDIELSIVGMRPGEKLYEELIIGSNPEKTTHSKIFLANEPYTPFSSLKEQVDCIAQLDEALDLQSIKAFIKKVCPGYMPE